ncbi:nucleotidyltransferase family protein [Danxiaibacter flavus]|uniref:Nucleotidyltransferase family protein n=1 Tax=Danxiaibacter flavus TaxID=3049108 RepID=A0ABV3Z9E8_9BACT|nr:nucleotidyltransferase family protein [Chitinophagaceae bacterium DXS]
MSSSLSNKPVKKALILAAGLGTRLKPWTDHHPKALALVNGKSLLQRNVEFLQASGIKDIIVNVHHFADQVLRTIEENNGWGADISISDETNEVLETGGGLLKASPFFEDEENCIMMNADVLTDLDLASMIALHESSSALATLAVSNRQTSRYFLFNNNDELCGWRNNKTGEEKIKKPSDNLAEKAFSGIHIINTRLFPLMHRNGKFSIVDVYLDLCATETIKAFDHSGRRFIDVGKPESIQQAEEMFG